MPSAKYSPSPHGRGFFISSLRFRLRFGSFLRGEGIGSLHLRLQSFTLRCATIHFFRLRFRSPMPGERGNDAGTYRNPSPLPPPAIISGRGSRSHALELLPIRRHPAAARCAHDSLCLSRFSNHRIRMERRHRRFLQHSVGVNRPGAFCPGSDHASALLIVGYCRGSSHRTRGPGTVAAGLPPAIHRQHHRRPTR